MSKSNHSQNDSSIADPEISRRSLMRKGAAGTVAAGGLAAGAQQAPPSLRPVGDAEAAVPLFLAGAAVGAGLMAAAGVASEEVKIGGGGEKADKTAERSVKDQIYNACAGVASQRPGYRSKWSQYINTSNPLDAPLTDTIFGQAEAAAIKAYEQEGNTVGDAKTIAKDVVDTRVTIAEINAIQSWNLGIMGGPQTDGIVGATFSAINEGTDQIRINDNHIDNALTAGASISGKSYDGWHGVESAKLGEDSYAATYVDLTDDDGWLKKPSEVGAVPDEVAMYGVGSNLPLGNTSLGPSSVSAPTVYCTHPEFDTVQPLKGGIYDNFLSNIRSIRSEVIDQVETYVDQFNTKLSKDDISPGDVVSPSTLYEEYGRSEDQSGASARLAAGGYAIPEDADNFEVKASHPSIPDSPRWGKLWLNYSKGVEPKPLKPGLEIPASNLSHVIFQYSGPDSSSLSEEVSFSPSSNPVKIVDVTGLNQESVRPVERAESANLTAGTNGKVYVWKSAWEGEMPDPLSRPADNPEWSVVVEGAATTDTRPVTETESDQTGVYLPQTNLSEGEAVEGIRLTDGADINQPIDVIDSPAQLSEDQIRQRIEGIESLADEIESLGGGSLGGGGLFNFGGNFPTIPGLGVGGTIVALFLGLFGLGQLSGN